MNLSDDFKAEGISLDGIKEMAAKVDKSTQIVTVEPDCSTVLYCYHQSIMNDTLFSRCHVLYDDRVSSDRSGRTELETQVLESRPSEFIKSLEKNVLVNFDMNYVDMSGSYFLSKYADKTLARMSGVRQMFIKRGSEMNAIFLASVITSLGEKVDIVTRSHNGLKKIFAFVGNQYKRTCLRDLASLAENILKDPEFELLNWEITQYSCILNIKNKDLIFSLQTSDICEFSDAIRVYYSANKERFLMDTIPFPSETEDLKQIMDEYLAVEKKINGIKECMTEQEMQATLSTAVGKKLAKLLSERENFKESIFNIHNIVELSEHQLELYRTMFSKTAA